jgi:hypothetical protein
VAQPVGCQREIAVQQRAQDDETAGIAVGDGIGAAG